MAKEDLLFIQCLVTIWTVLLGTVLLYNYERDLNLERMLFVSTFDRYLLLESL